MILRQNITVHTLAELDAKQEPIAKAVREGRTHGAAVEVGIHIKLPANSPCPCGSGRKWKNCCAEVESYVEVAFFPVGWAFEKVKRDPATVAGLIAAARALAVPPK